MIDSDTLFSAPVLAASSDGGSLVIFIVIAVITIVSKLIEWYKNKANNASEEEEMPSFNPGPSARKTMEEAIRKAVVEQQQKGRVSPPVPGKSQQSAPAAQRTTQNPPAPRTTATSQTIAPPPNNSRPRQETIPDTSTFFPEPQVPEMPAPAPYTPVSFDDINRNITELTDHIEKEARKTMEQAYASAESGYNMTMDLLEQSAKKAREQAKAVMENSIPADNGPLNFRTPGLLKKAVIMSEILASPKGLK